MSTPRIALTAIGRNTRDLRRAVDFHCGVLGFRLDAGHAPIPAWAGSPLARAEATGCAHLSLGAQRLELVEFPDAACDPPEPRANDPWFQHFAMVVADMEACRQRIGAHAVRFITRGGPQRLPPNTGSVTAFKFRDPEGHALELLQFAAGHEPPAWRSRLADGAGQPLGIDHSALCTGALNETIVFYEALGLRVSTHGLNRGGEQDDLDGLDGVALDVVALAVPGSDVPHVELLAYRQPRGRAATPPDDISALHAGRLCFGASDLPGLQAVMPPGCRPSTMARGAAPAAGELVLRDPDGHWVVVSEQGPDQGRDASRRPQ